MPLIIQDEDGRSFGPGQPYGYQGQYQGQRQPGIETANMRSIPQRTTPQRPPGQPSSGRHIGYGGGPQRQPITTGFGGEGSRIMGYEDPSVGSGDFLSSRYGGGLDDVAGMDDDARGMIEGAGFDIAGKTTDDRVIETLWGKAVNSLPVGTPQMEIEAEWEKLKEEYFRRKYT